VDAIHAGNQVFALFPTTHGHLPERRFIVVDYDSGWEPSRWMVRQRMSGKFTIWIGLNSKR
jgi:hypothetical protein